MALTRRSLLRYTVEEVLALADEAGGRRSFKLSDLPALSREQLGALVPAFVDEDGSRESAVLDDAGAPESAVWRRIDGQTSIAEIASRLAVEWGDGDDAAFERVRMVFLQLVSRGTCLPVNALES